MSSLKLNQTRRFGPHFTRASSPAWCVVCMLGFITCFSNGAFAQLADQKSGAQKQAAQPADEPAKLVVSAVAIAPPPPIIDAGSLLTALETADRTVATLQADVRYTKTANELEGGSAQEWRGRLLFTSAADANGAAKPGVPARRMFQVDFTELTVDGERRDEQQSFIFDGQWLVERQPLNRQVFKRQVVAPGKFLDPLAIGEGPFPIPIGQKKERILERFAAELLPPGDGFPEGRAPAAFQETWQLKLIPLPGAVEAKEFRSVRLWYTKDRLLPRLARTADRDGSSTEVFLTNVRPNEPLPDGTFDTSTPEGWDEHITEWRGEINEAGRVEDAGRAENPAKPADQP